MNQISRCSPCTALPVSAHTYVHFETHDFDDAVRAIAEQKGVHLLLLEDDKGNELVAASTKPFKVVC